MYKSVELNPTPQRIEVTFRTTVTRWDRSRAGYGTQVYKVIINNPVSFMYHTYGKGVITYYAEWFSKSVRPLHRYEITFDTLQIKSIKFIYEDYSIHNPDRTTQIPEE